MISCATHKSQYQGPSNQKPSHLLSFQYYVATHRIVIVRGVVRRRGVIEGMIGLHPRSWD